VDPLDSLREAVLRVAAALRRGGRGMKSPQKQKKVKLSGRRPAKAGPSAGCGTGSGGFKAGNNCAKEDGIPRKPLSQGGALKQPSAKQDFAAAKAMKAKAAAKKAAKEAAAKAKSAVEKPKREKQKKIDKLKKAAADRKAQKDAKSAAETKAAQEAVAKKKAAMLQKIRVKSANQKIAVVGTPKSIKQELQELKLKKASEKLAVSSTPKSIKDELDELKASMQNLKKIAAPTPKPAPAPPPPTVKPSNPPASSKVGELQHKKKNQLTPGDQDQLNIDRERVFGKDSTDGWKYGAAYQDSLKVRITTKIKTSFDAAKRLEKMGIKESDVTDEMLNTFDTSGKYYGSSAAADKLILDGVPAQYHRRYALSAGMVDSWANTSGDSSAKAIGIQYAIREEFNVKGAYTRHLTPKTTYGTVAKAEFKALANKVGNDKAVRAVVRAHYENTQARLKAEGISEITLVRGYSSSAKINVSGDQVVSLQPASSFSMDKSIAAGFSNNGGASKARHLVLRVPANRVLSTSVSGFGCLGEQEIVVLGGKVTGRVHKSAWSW
jgi:hypothetical protein